MKFDNDHHGFSQAVDCAQVLFRYLSEAASSEEWMTEMEELGGPEPVPFGAGPLKRLCLRFADRLSLRQQWWNNRAHSVLQELRAGQREGREDGEDPLLLWIVPYDVSEAVVGGAVRVRNLCRALARRFRVRIISLVGADAEGRRIPLAHNLDLLTFPMSRAMAARIEACRARHGVAAPLSALLEQPEAGDIANYLEFVRSETRLVILDSPYLYPAMKPVLGGLPLIYQTNDVAADFLRLLAADHSCEDVVTRLREAEGEIIRRAGLVVGVSDEDLATLAREYSIDVPRLLTVANGVETSSSCCIPPSKVFGLRKKWGPERPVVAFMGSRMASNLEAVRFITSQLAPTMPAALFAIIGLRAQHLGPVAGSAIPSNVVFCGKVSATAKETILALADMAIAPMAQGTGSSLKIPDFVAHGKPVVATEIGVRSFNMLRPFIRVTEFDRFAAETKSILTDLKKAPAAFDAVCLEARKVVEKSLDWRTLAQPLLLAASSVAATR